MVSTYVNRSLQILMLIFSKLKISAQRKGKTIIELWNSYDIDVVEVIEFSSSDEEDNKGEIAPKSSFSGFDFPPTVSNISDRQRVQLAHMDGGRCMTLSIYLSIYTHTCV
ncbi:hypothetical protein RIF29_39090 [Crotalaria pallida]|uniref:Uncharacterized protein n=1 Tax=Crotalaria pallida TaxID=3830 RepID=A0AAN9E2A7_CROPI